MLVDHHFKSFPSFPTRTKCFPQSMLVYQGAQGGEASTAHWKAIMSPLGLAWGSDTSKNTRQANGEVSINGGYPSMDG